MDSDESVLEAVEAILRDGNQLVRSVVELSEAQQLLGHQEFDAIVADINMAGHGTDSFENWLAANKPALARRVVWMSAAATPDVPSRENGGAPVIQKPFKAADLLAAIEAVLGGVQVTPIHR